MTGQVPSVVRMVHYVSQGSPYLEDGTQLYPSVCRAAIITAVPEGGTDDDPDAVFASLCVINPTGLHFREYVLQDETDHTAGTWHWPERV